MFLLFVDCCAAICCFCHGVLFVVCWLRVLLVKFCVVLSDIYVYVLLLLLLGVPVAHLDGLLCVVTLCG